MAGVLSLWETLKEAIVVYTGLSPVAFFTVLVVAVSFYQVVSGFFKAPGVHTVRVREAPDVEPLPLRLRRLRPEEALLMAIKAQIYDVSQSRMFYGPGGPYALFAGRDASRALAKMSFEEKDLTGTSPDWEYKFMSKYVKVGTVRKTLPVEGAPASSSGEEAEAAAGTAEASS
ncbi:unnamed protein product [Spirodela intermedia]|uniref:Cytochrome b5 heme-binding domain-containing protein n=1 Tax=Spirodela intermedia TaxID=51605 RepID=A0A7I8IFI6_SPIIN|nr:unnamed protein product [Spirodela intermedia]CAA6655642.1 unnamed protein product [Spirodela intermedia]